MNEISHNLEEAQSSLNSLLARVKTLTKQLNVELEIAEQEIDEYSAGVYERYRRLIDDHKHMQGALIKEIEALEAETSFTK